jgi:rare lipoprotein A
VACGGALNEGGMTAAHRTLPCGTKVRVTNKKNGKSVTVTINDRGPFVSGRVIDVTPTAARALGFSGLAPVSVSKQ